MINHLYLKIIFINNKKNWVTIVSITYDTTISKSKKELKLWRVQFTMINWKLWKIVHRVTRFFSIFSFCPRFLLQSWHSYKWSIYLSPSSILRCTDHGQIVKLSREVPAKWNKKIEKYEVKIIARRKSKVSSRQLVITHHNCNYQLNNIPLYFKN